MTDRAQPTDETDSAAEQPGDGESSGAGRPSEAGADGEGVRTAPAVPDGVATTESYEDDGAVVLYDAENPLAWVEADSAVTLSKMA